MKEKINEINEVYYSQKEQNKKLMTIGQTVMFIILACIIYAEVDVALYQGNLILGICELVALVALDEIISGMLMKLVIYITAFTDVIFKKEDKE